MRGLVCMIVGHHRDGTRVRSDGFNYRAPCRRCRTPMIKDILGEWRPIDPDRDEEIAAWSARAR